MKPDPISLFVIPIYFLFSFGDEKNDDEEY